MHVTAVRPCDLPGDEQTQAEMRAVRAWPLPIPTAQWLEQLLHLGRGNILGSRILDRHPDLLILAFQPDNNGLGWKPILDGVKDQIRKRFANS